MGYVRSLQNSMTTPQSNNKIPCTVGILTWNSSATLRKCLESVRDFGEILVADGGSTDDTVAIAQEYGAIVVPQSKPGHPIKDFALERNRQSDRASMGWFFYLDSDEVASPGLVEHIRKVTTENPPQHHFWEIRMQLVSPDHAQEYVMFKSVYQIRLWDRTTGARMSKPIHEKIRFDQSVYTVGRMEEPWYVPIGNYLDSMVMKKKMQRNATIIEGWHSRNLFELVQKLLHGLAAIAKLWIKRLVLEVCTFHRGLVPIQYDIHMTYELGYLLCRYVHQYMKNLQRAK